MEKPLWAPWRMEYILGPKTRDACVFCVAETADTTELDERLVVFGSARALVMLNRYPFAPGHLLVMPRTHKSSLEELDRDEHLELFDLVTRSVSHLRRAVRCDGLNVGMNLGAPAGAGIAEHMHVHIVPRWNGDTNFMPVIADTRVVPQALDETRRHLARFFSEKPNA